MNFKNPDLAPRNPIKHPRFGDIQTFNRLPYIENHLLHSKKIDVLFLGIPFDGGTTFRPGSRFAPRAVRQASALNRNYNPAQETGPFFNLSAADGGDILVNPLNIQQTFQNIEKHLSQVFQNNTRTICVGGDHSILLPILRAIRKKHGDFTLVHFDAHTDTADQAWGERYHHGTPIRRALEEKLITGSSIFQIGIRGPVTTPEEHEYCKKNKIQTLGMDDFNNAAKNKAFFSRLRKKAGKKPVYITFDVDGVDPAFAPGTGTPVIGGMTSGEALNAVRALKGLHIVGADVVEVSPPYDHAELTSLLAAGLCFEFASLMSITPRKD